LFLKNKESLYFLKLFLFIFLYKAGEYTFDYLETIPRFSGTFDRLYYILSDGITVTTAAIYSLIYTETHTAPQFVISINGIQTIQMMKGCTGLMQVFQVVFILLFFPVSFKNKLLFLPVSVLIIIFASVLHYLILVPVAYSFHDSFTVFHNIISRVVFYIFFFINFVLWNKYS
jgi:exosortase/archaeosortase family protein